MKDKLHTGIMSGLIITGSAILVILIGYLMFRINEPQKFSLGEFQTKTCGEQFLDDSNKDSWYDSLTRCQ
jgi:hypothetical protein